MWMGENRGVRRRRTCRWKCTVINFDAAGLQEAEVDGTQVGRRCW
jgi:hypothetical protein